MTMLFVCLSPTLTTCFRQRAPLLVMISGGVYCLDSSEVLLHLSCVKCLLSSDYSATWLLHGRPHLSGWFLQYALVSVD